MQSLEDALNWTILRTNLGVFWTLTLNTLGPLCLWQCSNDGFLYCSPIYFSWLETSNPHQLVLFTRRKIQNVHTFFTLFAKLQIRLILHYLNCSPFFFLHFCKVADSAAVLFNLFLLARLDIYYRWCDTTPNCNSNYFCPSH